MVRFLQRLFRRRPAERVAAPVSAASGAALSPIAVSYDEQGVRLLVEGEE